MPSELRCKATREDGEPCGAPASFVDPETGLCWTHSEEGREKAREAARKGGRAKARKDRRDGLEPGDLPPLDSPQAAERWCEVVGRAVATGRLSHHEGKAVVRAVREFLRSHEAGEYTERVEELEEKVAAIKRGDLEVVR